MPDDIAGASYTSYTIQRVRYRDTGLAVLPVAGEPPQRAVAVRVHAPFEYEKVYWTASRDGGPPDVPSPELDNANRMFLGGWQLMDVPVPVGSEGSCFALAGVYLYSILDPEGLTGDFFSGRLPMDDNADPDFNYLPSSNIKPGLISTRSATGADADEDDGDNGRVNG